MKFQIRLRIILVVIFIIFISCSKNNNPPIAEFSLYPLRGDSTTIFLFDAGLSVDAEESVFGLYVRWDWESDGIWDTGFTREKTINHIFERSGYINVTMEIKDNADNLASFSKEIIVGKNLSSKITDHRDGRLYQIVKIGDQWWFAENLNVGLNIDITKTQMDNRVIEKYCYNNDSIFCQKFGGIYLWGEMISYSPYSVQQKLHPTDIVVKGICPDGWHIPSLSEWEILLKYLPRGTELILEGGLYGIDFKRKSWEMFSSSNKNPEWTFRNSSFWTSSMINNYHYSVEPVIEGYWWANYGNNGLAIRCVKDSV